MTKGEHTMELPLCVFIISEKHSSLAEERMLPVLRRLLQLLLEETAKDKFTG